MTPEQALVEIDGLEKFGIHLGLERVVACLAALGDPHRQVPCVHVGGTNGKGSTASLIADALSACGLRTGLFTSPPLEFFGERIRVDGELLADDAVPALYRAVLAAQASAPGAAGMTQFEIITVMAFLHFARVGADLAVVEVGLGGRLDSTNVVLPEVAVITNVGLEHSEHLGETLAAITAEKGGIVKPGVPLVTAAKTASLQVLAPLAAAKGAPLYAMGRDFDAVSTSPGRIDYQGFSHTWADVKCGLRGPHQVLNLATALATLELLSSRGWDLPEAKCRQGLARAVWPGRLEVCGEAPVVLLDGAHNPHASRALAEALGHEFRYRELWLVLGILGDKDARSILTDLLPLADHVVLTASTSQRAIPEGELADLAAALYGRIMVSTGSVGEALALVLDRAAHSDLICVTGSLSTVGEARGHLRRLGRVS